MSAPEWWWRLVGVKHVCGVGTRGVSRVWVTLYETHRTAHTNPTTLPRNACGHVDKRHTAHRTSQLSSENTPARARPHTRSSARRKPAALKKCKAYNSTEHTLDALSPLRVPLQAECLVAGMTASPNASPR